MCGSCVQSPHLATESHSPTISGSQMHPLEKRPELQSIVAARTQSEHLGEGFPIRPSQSECPVLWRGAGLHIIGRLACYL